MQGLLRRLNSHNRLPAIFVVVAGVFVVSQAFAAMHVEAYGDETHDHNGNPCVVSMIAKAGDKAVAAAGAAIGVAFIKWRAGGVVAQTELAHIAIRAANPRGPPGQ